MTAQIFLRIFSVTTRLSKYLQTSGLDLLTAKRLISVAPENINKISRDFDGVEIAADFFGRFGQRKSSIVRFGAF